MKLSENFWKTDERLLNPNFVRIKQKHCHKKGNIFRKIFCEFSVNYQQTVRIYLSKSLRILHDTSRKFIFKTLQDLVATEVEVHTAIGRSVWLWTDLALTNQIARFRLAIQ